MTETEEISFSSHDGHSTCRGTMWKPAGKPRAVVQIVHGMCEHIGRYAGFAEALCERGWLVVGIDHVGHGRTTPDANERGVFDPKTGADTLIEDQHFLRMLMSGRVADVPYIVFGHSMGSFVTRCYLGRHGDTIDGCVLSGTAWQSPALLAVMPGMLSAMAGVRGWGYRSSFVDGLGTGGYNKKFAGTGAQTGYEWLSRDEEDCVAYAKDPDCGFVFSLSGYYVLSQLLRECQTPSAIAEIPKDLPVLLIAGSDDPVGSYGTGPATAFRVMRKAGMTRTELSLVKDARHEILFELEADETIAEICDWIQTEVVDAKEAD